MLVRRKSENKDTKAAGAMWSRIFRELHIGQDVWNTGYRGKEDLELECVPG